MAFTNESLTRKFGITVPQDFGQFLRTVAAEGRFDETLEKVTAFMLADPDARYETFPPEFFPFFDAGVDGIAIGWAVHHPAEGADYPVVQMCPADSGGAYLVGNNTREALENMLSSALDSDEPAKIALIEKVAKAMDLKVKKGSPGSELVFLKQKKRAVPAIPKGWTFMTTLDGIGVLAESNKFDPDHGAQYTADEWPELDEFLDMAEAAMEAGYPASALVHIRNYICDPPDWSDYGPLMMEAYKKLGRPLLAKRCKKNADA